MFELTLWIGKEYDIPLLRVHERIMMDEIIETGIFLTKELVQIQRVRDGSPEMETNSEGNWFITDNTLKTTPYARLDLILDRYGRI